MADAVGELGFEANLTRRLHLHSGFALKFGLLLDLHLQLDHFLLLDPEMEIEKKINFREHNLTVDKTV